MWLCWNRRLPRRRTMPPDTRDLASRSNKNQLKFQSSERGGKLVADRSYDRYENREIFNPRFSSAVLSKNREERPKRRKKERKKERSWSKPAKTMARFLRERREKRRNKKFYSLYSPKRRCLACLAYLSHWSNSTVACTCPRHGQPVTEHQEDSWRT